MKADPPSPDRSSATTTTGTSHPAPARSEGRDPPSALHGRLLHVSRMATIGEMAAGVAHELNQPLTAIATYAQACERLLGRPDVDPADLREALRQIADQALRAADIIRRLRTLARTQQSEHAPAAINSLVREILDLLQADARVHDVQLSLDLAEQLPNVLVDSGQIQQVILNFVRNGIEALALGTPGPRQIVIRTSLTPEREVEMAVIDNGPGLAPEAIERMFDPFFSTKSTGTGLGLAISNTIARAHRGCIGYRPTAPHGACFYIHLPEHNG
jgi:two-component system, LuxR family, sensor kinase FixL